MSNPWKRLGSTVKYENPWIRVREDAVIRPDGKPGIYGVVEAKKLAAGVLALTDNDELYLVGQYRYPTETYSWEIIEGGIEEGEDPLTGIQRELQEEAGLIASHWEQMPGESHLSNCFSNERAVFFIARGLTEIESSPDPEEILQVKKVPFSTAKAMVLSGEIFDAMSVMAILRYAVIS